MKVCVCVCVCACVRVCVPYIHIRMKKEKWIDGSSAAVTRFFLLLLCFCFTTALLLLCYCFATALLQRCAELTPLPVILMLNYG